MCLWVGTLQPSTATCKEKAGFKFLFLISSPSPLTFALLHYQPRVRCGKVRKFFCENNKCSLGALSMLLEVIIFGCSPSNIFILWKS